MSNVNEQYQDEPQLLRREDFIKQRIQTFVDHGVKIEINLEGHFMLLFGDKGVLIPCDKRRWDEGLEKDLHAAIKQHAPNGSPDDLVPVDVAVAINEYGHWWSCGYHIDPEQDNPEDCHADMKDSAVEGIDFLEREKSSFVVSVHWLKALLPKPLVRTMGAQAQLGKQEAV